MAAFIGSALDIKWVHSAGTASLNGDFRSFSYTPSVDLVDQTAGNDTNKTYLTALKDGRASLSCLLQAGTAAGGTAMTAVLTEGSSGTIIWSPEGTAATKPKYTMAAIAMGAASTVPYAGAVEITCDFQQNSARTEGTN